MNNQQQQQEDHPIMVLGIRAPSTSTTSETVRHPSPSEAEDSVGGSPGPSRRAGPRKGFVMVWDVNGPIEEGCGQERLKRHQVQIPEMWGQVEDSMDRARPWKGFAMVPDVDGPREEGCGRERLKRHRVEMSGRVWIPEMWGQEELMKEWADFSNFDGSLVPNGLMSAREALMGGLKRQRVEMAGRRAGSGGLRIKNPC